MVMIHAQAARLLQTTLKYIFNFHFFPTAFCLSSTNYYRMKKPSCRTSAFKGKKTEVIYFVLFPRASFPNVCVSV